jgi:EAL domain-containing protein (putative c-di-GMP-specific phosphodiesterase class I)
MYKAKEPGRNHFEYFTAEMNRHAMERLELLNHLRQAIVKGEFVLHYQPRVDLVDGRVIGAEALLRWHSAKHGIVSPGSFIALAKESGLIVPISEWILRTACAQNVAW